MKSRLSLSLFVILFVFSVSAQKFAIPQTSTLKSKGSSVTKQPVRPMSGAKLTINQKNLSAEVDAALGPSRNIHLLETVPSVGAWAASRFRVQERKSLKKPQPFHTMPVNFIPNVFGVHNDVKFLTQGLNGALLFKRKGLVFSEMKRHGKEMALGGLELWFEGANSQVEITGEMRTEGKANFIVGNDESWWRTNVPIFSAVVYRELYEGIDLHFLSDADVLVKSEYHVKPGADPRRIRLVYPEVESIDLDRRGALVITSKGGLIRKSAPLCYQESGDRRIPVPCKYVIKDRNKVAFRIGDYNRKNELIIDPKIMYSTYFGTDSRETGEAIKADTFGNVYIAGYGFNGFPTTAGAYQTGDPWHNSGMYVAKFNSNGKKLIYSTLITAPTSVAEAYDMAVDDYGYVYLTGYTNALDIKKADFPVKNAWDSSFDGNFDAFVLKLSSAGDKLIFSTYLGSQGQDFAYAIDLDSKGNIYVAGGTTSTQFPATTGAYQGVLKGACDAFLSKFDANGKLNFSTLLGGSGGEKGFALAADDAENAYIAGWTKSQDFPVTSGAIGKKINGSMDIFLTKLKTGPNESPSFSTYIGGSGSQYPNAIDIDQQGNTYLTGETSSNDFPTKKAVSTKFGGGTCPKKWQGSCPLTADAFATAVNTNASDYIYSTYLGGKKFDVGHDITVTPNGTAYITGWTVSDTFPVKDAIYSKHAGETDAFVAVLEKSGALKNSAFLGGSDFDYGSGIALDGWGSAYVVGSTLSANFPVKDAYDSSYHPYSGTIAYFKVDIFVTKIEYEKVTVKLPPKGSFWWLWTTDWWDDLKSSIEKK
jgi:hypothetical protein